MARAAAGALAMLVAAALASPSLAAQVLDEPLPPAGRVGLSVRPSFETWDTRFGEAPDGSTDEIPLGARLSVPSALDLFPGADELVSALRDVSGLAGYTPTVGPVEAAVTYDVTRIDLGLHIGITSWLSVGAVVPRIKNRTAVALAFQPDTLAGDLGVNPALGPSAGGVQAFLDDLGAAREAARARAEALCAAGDPTCPAATLLAERAAELDAGLGAAYGATPLFPVAGTPVGSSLVQAVTALDAELQAAGLSGVPSPPLSEQRLASGDLAALPARFAGLGYRTPLGGGTSLWTWGDIELSAMARLLTFGEEDAPGRETPHVQLLGGALLRLGTGLAADPDEPLGLASGDGQTDVELRLAARGTLGRRIALRAAARYGTQGGRTLVRRVTPLDQVLAPASARTSVTWSPGAYWGVEAEPAYRLTRALTLGGVYRGFFKDRDAYALAPGANEPPRYDVAVLALGTGMKRHQVGGALVYDLRARARTGDAPPLYLQGRLMHTVAGSGGRTPATTRVEIGGTWFPRIWGGS